MTVPKWFSDQLARDHGGILRIRWSNRNHRFLVEEKLAPGQLIEPPQRPDGTWDTENDEWIRVRDGYARVMEITPGTLTRCPGGCGLELRVPFHKIAEVRCARCKSWGLDGRYVLGFFPLNEDLLSRLRRLNPVHGQIREFVRELDAQNARLIAQRDREFSNHTEAMGKEFFPQMFEIQSVGYTGKEFSA